jgi:hypothetical protein
VTPNDAGDADGGPNLTQNFPVLVQAVNANGQTVITGTLNGAPSTAYRLQFFASPAPDPSGFGEGQTYLDQTTVNTDDEGNLTFTYVPRRAAPSGTVVAATATDAANNTSEFSNAVIANPPGSFVLAASTLAVDEAAGTATIAIARTGGTSGPASVTYSTSSGTASPNADYTPVANTLFFDNGEATKNITIPIVDDAADEPAETFFLSLSAPTNRATPGTITTATISITDNDATPAASVDSPTVAEGTASTSTLVFTVSLSAPSGQPVSVDYALSSGTAEANLDFAARSGTLNFAPGETSRTVSVPVVGDALDEADETLSLVLADPSNATLAGALGTGTIADDDAAPTLSVGAASVSEGDRGSSNLVFTASLSAPSGRAISVGYATAGGSAAAEEDFTAASGTLTFAPGETSKAIAVAVRGDIVAEGDETLALNFSDPANASLAAASAPATILDDDVALLSLAISPSILSEGGTATGTISRTTSTSAPLAVAFSSSDTSEATVPATVTIPAGQLSTTFAVSGAEDTAVDGAQNAVISASAPGLASAQAGVTILDNDSAPSDGGLPTAREDIFTTTGRVLRVEAPGVLVNDFDAHNDTLRAVLVRAPLNGTLALAENGSFTYTPQADFGGTDTFAYAAADATGRSLPVTVTVRVGAVPDTTPPVVSLVGGAQQVLARLVAPRGVAEDVFAVGGRSVVASGIANVVIRLQNARGQYFNGRVFHVAPFDLRASRSANGSFVLVDALPSRALAPDGRYIVTAIATDRAGKTARATQTITLDSTAPIVTITTPSLGTGGVSAVANLVRVSGTATGANRVEIAIRRANGQYFNGSGYQSAPFRAAAVLSGSTFSQSAGLPTGANLAPGRYTIEVRASDAAGNVATAVRVVVVTSSAAI